MKNDNHNTGNIGLRYACYRLAVEGWNVMPTARNARGVDILVSGAKGKSKSIQVKTLSGINPVNITNVDTIDVEYLIVVMNARGLTGTSANGETLGMSTRDGDRITRSGQEGC